MEEFPLRNDIVFCSAENSKPLYLTEDTKLIDLSERLGRDVGLGDASVAMADREAMLARSGLDPSQQVALDHALTHRLAIIQGPPGCGKTFIGIKLVALLLSMRPRPKTPILVLTYKNHALDEFLKGLLAFLRLDEIVRIGGRSRETELESCNIKLIDRKQMDHSLLEQINGLKDEIRGRNDEVTQHMCALQAASTLTVEDLLEACTEDQLRDLLLSAPYGKGKDDIPFWFRPGKPANRQNVSAFLANFPSVGKALLHCRSTGWKSKDEKHLQKLFYKVLEKWMPSADCFEQLKKLQTQNLHYIQAAQARLNQDDENDDECEDEELLESIMEARLAAQGRSRRDGDPKTPRSRDVVFFRTKIEGEALINVKDFPPDMEANEQVLGSSSFWPLNDVQRIGLLYTLLSLKTEEYSAQLCEALEDLDQLAKSLEELKAHMKAGAVREKKIIGMTITGASMNHQLIKEVAPAIVIVEEAAEVLEADLLAALTPGLQHLVLIGDHKQLRPKEK
jgi:hypothetical protein